MEGVKEKDCSTANCTQSKLCLRSQRNDLIFDLIYGSLRSMDIA